MVVDQEKEKRRKRAVAKHRLREKEDKNLIKIVKWWVNILLEPIGGCWGGGIVESAGSDAEMSRWEIHQLKYTEKKLVRCAWDMAWGDWGTLHVWPCVTRADCLNRLIGFTSFVTSEMLLVCVLQRSFCQQRHAVYKTAESPQSVGAFSCICLHVFLNWLHDVEIRSQWHLLYIAWIYLGLLSCCGMNLGPLW